MNGEVDFYGVYVPSAVVWTMLAFCVVPFANRIARSISLHSFVWYRPLFDLSAFAIVLGAVAVLTSSWRPL
jgi:hypothetical protein